MSVLDMKVSVFRFFEEISKIPRGSYHEEKIADYLVDFATKRNLEYYRDSMNNVIIYKKGSLLKGKHEPLMLQAHIDMVCEKESDYEHDFENDSLDLYIEDGYLKAKGTTLGADDGCGVAIMLSLLDDKNAKHPPLECVFTVQEEVGLCGAAAIDPSMISARRMINLDCENEFETVTSSSGGREVKMVKTFKYEKNESPVYSLSIKGLTGGHSGMLIDQEKANSIKLTAKLLHLLIKNDVDVRIASIEGGLKDNAIPRDCTCLFASTTDHSKIEEIIGVGFDSIRAQYRKQEPTLSIELKPETSKQAINNKDSEAIINTLFLAPNGMIAKSKEIEGLTLISLNCGILRTYDDYVEITYSLRSPILGAVEDMNDQLELIGNLYGFETKAMNGYGGWEYDPNSKLRKAFLDFFKKEYNREIRQVATHGGLETGIFKEKIPDMDIITFGPDMSGVHTPDEQLDIASFERVYHFVREFLETL